MSRTTDRLLGGARARLRRLGAVWKQALTSDQAPGDRHTGDDAEAAELARTAGQMRGGLAKVAQLRAYLELEEGLSPEARGHLAAMWDRVPPDPPQAIRAVIEEDLGASPEQLFAAWDDTPLAAASLGQVHAARLADGTEVAVKVQYPGIADALRDDLGSPAVLRQLIGPGLGDGAAREVLQTLRAAIARELDYTAERGALERFGAAYFGDAEIKLPRPIADRSRGRVLTMTRLPGVPLPAFTRQASPADRSLVGRALVRFGLGAPLRHGVVNGDPHPGNYLVDPAAPAQVGFVDFGFVVELEQIAAIDRRLFLSLVHRDGEALRFAAHEEGLVPRAGTFDQAAWRDFERALSAPFVKRGVRRFGPAEASAIAQGFQRLVRSRAVHLTPEAVVLWRQRVGFFTVLGSLAPELDLRELLCGLIDDGRHPTPLYERYP